jgi:hypothetical protein
MTAVAGPEDLDPAHIHAARRRALAIAEQLLAARLDAPGAGLEDHRSKGGCGTEVAAMLVVTTRATGRSDEKRTTSCGLVDRGLHF